MSLAGFVSFECDSFPFGFEGGAWDLIALTPDHRLPFNCLIIITIIISLPLNLSRLRMAYDLIIGSDV